MKGALQSDFSHATIEENNKAPEEIHGKPPE
jgi:hypothetical protein